MGSEPTHIADDRPAISEAVETKFGKVRGKKFHIGGDRYVNAYMGIPYAKPPIGELRFKAPEEPEKWDGIKDCLKFVSRPPQIDMFLEEWYTSVPINEDCLYLNVFSPDWKVETAQGNSSRAVLVWIHGGGYVMQSAANYGDIGICKYLCSKEIIVVTVEYRLGILGFTATGDSSITPNLGLRDQALALKWINENISAFGGNPVNVTLFGQSAGASCVDILALSPYTRDLFQKAIVMGGSASSELALQSPTHVRDVVRTHAKLLGWTEPQGSDAEKNENLMKFLCDQPVEGFELGIGGRPGFPTNACGVDIAPVVDGDFIPEPIAQLRKKAPKKIWMAGVTDLEALILCKKEEKSYRDLLEEKLIKEIPEDKYPNFEELRKEARALYAKSSAPEEEMRLAFVKLLSDALITNAVHDCAVEMLKEGHKVYLYNFEYVNEDCFGVMFRGMPFYAATHAVELIYIFGENVIGPPFPFNEADRKVIRDFSALFANFAKYGNPNGDQLSGLEPIDKSNPWRYICINKDGISRKENFQGRRAEFWRKMKQGNNNAL